MALTKIISNMVSYLAAGAGAVLRTLQDKLRDTVSVKDFGAVGNGVANDATAIQAAIDAVYTAGGGRIKIPAGVYILNSSLNRKPGVYLEGDGSYATELRASGNFPVITSIGSISNILNRGGIKSMLIRGGGKSSANAYGIHEEWTNRTIHEDVRFHSCRQAMKAANIWQCKWDNLQADGGGGDQNYIGFYMGEVDPANPNNAVTAVNCTAQDVEQYGWRLINFNGSKFVNCEGMNGVHAWYLGDPTTGNQPVRWGHFTNCLGDTTTGHTWRLELGAATAMEQIQMSNIWAGTSTTGHTFYVGGCSQITISNLQSVSANKSAAYFTGCSSVVLTGSNLNNYDGAAGANPGIALVNSVGMHITGNHAYSASGSAKGLVESGTSDLNIVTGNFLQNGGTKVGTNSKFFRNVGMVCENAGSAVILAANTSVTVTHGMAFTPSINDVRLTPRDGMGSTTKISAQNMTSTTFDIVANVAPGGNIQIGWGIDPGA